MTSINALASKKLAELEAGHAKRSLKDACREDGVHVMRGEKRLISFSCNDYLGLSTHPEVKAAAIEAIEKYGAGAGASRLVTGNHPLYAELETALSQWKGEEAALVFGSGYLANIGLIQALVERDDLIIGDKLIHACMVDGARLSGAEFVRFKHNDMADCERLLKAHRAKYTQCLLLTESVFSMDGDQAPLAELLKLAEEFDANIVCDDAHYISSSSGLTGGSRAIHSGDPRLRGDDKLNSRNDRIIRMGTLSKAIGAYGGYVCGSRLLIDYLQTTARSLIYSTALPPAVVASAIAALKIIKQKPELLSLPLHHAEHFTLLLGLPKAHSAIVPIIIGDSEKALAASAALEVEGFLVSAIRPPTVPANTARLRVTFSARHTDEMVVALAQAIQKLGIL